MESLDPEQADALLRQQDALQAEAARVVVELGLLGLLGRVGAVEQHGSSVSGLMTWRDIDFTVIAPDVTGEAVFVALQPLLAHPHITGLRYQNELGARSFSGLARDERLFYMLYYDTAAGESWKLDISFWRSTERYGEGDAARQFARDLSAEQRLAILWIKDAWHGHPGYRVDFSSMDIYAAVLDHGLRTPTAFGEYLERTNKKAPSPRIGRGGWG